MLVLMLAGAVQVTSYANAYVESLGVSPFSSKGGKV